MSIHIDPIALGKSVARAALHQDRHTRLTALPGGRGVPGQARPTRSPIVAHIELDAVDVRLLLQALNYPGVTPRLAAIGERISGQLHPSLLPSADDCSPHGMERPS